MMDAILRMVSAGMLICHNMLVSLVHILVSTVGQSIGGGQIYGTMLWCYVMVHVMVHTRGL